MALNKRGVFFTLMTIIILSIFIFSSIYYSDYLSRESVQKRAETLDNFVYSVEKDMERQLYINGFRAIFLLEKRITDSGAFQVNTQSVFQEAFYNGTLYGTPELLLTPVKYNDTLREVRNRAKSINANVTFSNPVLSVYQIDPWHVVYHLNVDFYLEDLNGLVSWNKTMNVETDIGIETFSDPLYLHGTANRQVNKFIQTPFTTFVSGSNYDNLITHMDNGYYIASSDAPSFLMRLEGDLGNSSYGIESLVDLDDLQQGTAQQKAIIDHIYFSASNPGTCSPVPGNSNIRIENSTGSVHPGLYNVSADC